MLRLAQSIPALVAPIATLDADPWLLAVENGTLLSESLVKQMTGGDPLPARHLYAKPFEFVPWFKLIVAGNHKPQIRGSDEGIWRRIGCPRRPRWSSRRAFLAGRRARALPPTDSAVP